MSDPQIHIDPDLMRSQAASLDGIAADIHEARQAAASTGLGGSSFGLLCAFLVLPATAVMGAGAGMVAAAGVMVERSAANMRGAADSFDEGEAETQAVLDTVRVALESQVDRMLPW